MHNVAVDLQLGGCPVIQNAWSFTRAIGISLSALLIASVVSCAGHEGDSFVGEQHDAVLAVPGETVLPPDQVNGITAGGNFGSPLVTGDGVAHFTIPLWVPPGRAGMQPDLALEYNSRGANGLFGVGWTLTGLSEITYCRPNYAIDGHVGVASEFCLDGNRMVLASGMHGAVGATYKTQPDSFRKIVLSNEKPLTFTVNEKSGRILTYQGQFSQLPLVRAQDRFGNYFTITYQVPNPNIVGSDLPLYPDTISYTAHDANPELPLNRAVIFKYESRVERVIRTSPRRYLSQYSPIVPLYRRVKRLEMWGPNEAGKSTLLRAYDLAYRNDTVTQRSLLARITERDANGVSKRPISLDWEAGAVDFSPIDTTVSDFDADTKWFRLVDLNGDGQDDLFYVPTNKTTYHYRLSAGKGSTDTLYFDPTPVDTQIPVVDRHVAPVPIRYDLDEKADLILLSKDPLTNTTKPCVWRSSGVQGSVALTQVSCFAKAHVLPADLNGDGLTDVLNFDDGDVHWQYYMNNGGSGFFAPQAIDLSVPGVGGAPKAWATADFNSDGQDDLIGGYGTPWGPVSYVFFPGQVEYPPSRFEDPTPPLHAFESFENGLYLDSNGDGYADLWLLNSLAPRMGVYRVNTKLNSTNPGVYLTDENYTLFTCPFDYKGSVRAFDYNGDGAPGLIGVQDTKTPQGTWQIMPCDRNGGATTPAGAAIDIGTTDPSAFDYFFETGDVDGNGLADVVAWMNGKFVVFARRGAKPDMLTRVTSGTGAWVAFEYQPISNHDVYSTTNFVESFQYPKRPVTSGLWVVGSHWETGNFYRHRYEDAMEDVIAGGFVGFAKHSIEFYAQGVTVEEQYDLSSYQGMSIYPSAGVPNYEIKTTDLGQGKTFRRVTSRGFNVQYDPANKVYYSYVSRNDVEEDQIVGGVAKPVFKSSTSLHQNAFGDIDASTTTTGIVNGTPVSGETRTLSVDYENNPDKWIVGHPHRIVEQSTIGLGFETATRTTLYQYDDRGALRHQVIEPGTEQVDGTVSPLPQPQSDGVRTLFIRYDVDALGQTTRISYGDAYQATPSERYRTISYDTPDHDFPTAIQNKLGHQTLVAFHPGLGVLAATQDANGVYSHWQYDTFGRLKLSFPGGAETQAFTYGPLSAAGSSMPEEMTTKSASGAKVFVRFDPFEREVERQVSTRTDQRAVVTTVQYDQRNQLPSLMTRPHFSGAPAAADQIIYDNLNRVLRRQQADGSSQEFEYNGRTVDVWDGSRNAIGTPHRTITLDAAGQVVSSVEHGGLVDHATSYTYAPFGLLDSISSDDSRTFGFDRLGRRISMDDPTVGHRDLSFSVFGELETEVFSPKSGSAETRRLYYDDLGRLSRKSTRDGDTTFTWDTSANGIGKLASVTSPDSVTVGYAYDAQGRVGAKTWNVGADTFVISRDYDSFGRLARIKYPSVQGATFAVLYQYGPYGDLQTIVNESTQAAFWTALEQDSSGKPINPSGAFPYVQLGNGIVSSWIENPARAGVLQSIRSKLGNTWIQNLSYDFDANLNLRARADAVNALGEQFGYDQFDRLHRWTTFVAGKKSTQTRYDYDTRGSLAARVPEFGSGEHATYAFTGERGAGPYGVTAENGTELFAYDAEGNQNSADQRTIQFTSFGLPARVTNGAGTTTFGYDAFEKRVFRRGPGSASGPVTIGYGAESVTLDDLYERRKQGYVTTHVFTVQAPTGPVAQYLSFEGFTTAKPTTLYLLSDHLGSVDTITDGTGKVVEVQKFSPFGSRISPTNPGAPAPARRSLVRLGFTGHMHDDDLQLINMRGRMYDPGLGRFVAPDVFAPDMSRALGLNSYAYGYNNPLRFTDPTGLAPTENPNPGPTPPNPNAPPPTGCSNCGAGAGFSSNQSNTGHAVPHPTGWQSEYSSTAAAEARAAASRVPTMVNLGTADQLRAQVQGFGGCSGAAAPAGQMCVGNVTLSDGRQYDLYQPLGSNPRGSNAPLNVIGQAFAAWLPGLHMNPDTKKALEGAMLLASVVPIGPLLKGIGGEIQALVQSNRVAGNAFRDELAAALKAAGREVEKEVYHRTPFGKRYIDIEVSMEGDVLGGIETKFGSSRYTPWQRLKDLYLWYAKGYRVNLVRGP